MLDKREMQAFAKQIGFDGDDEAWSEEFAELCKEHGCASAAAVLAVHSLGALRLKGESEAAPSGG